MVATINASVSSSGIVSTADGSGIVKLQSNGVATNALAWVRFNGSGVISSSYNVSSISVLGSAVYGVNFTNALTDANYSFAMSTGVSISGGTNYNYGYPNVADYGVTNAAVPTTSQLRVLMCGTTGAAFGTFSFDRLCVIIFGN